MPDTIRDVMTKDPAVLSTDSSVAEAARVMATEDIGNVVVTEGDQVVGIVTDRDIVVRAVAEGRQATGVKIGEICSRDLTTLSPDDTVENAVKLMREKAIRRLPIVEGGRPVGIVALGDLAVWKEPDSALADVSADAPNN